MPQSLVRLESAGVERAGRWLVRDIDLEVERGEIVTLIGPNGSGKSTTARMALGIIAPSEGVARRAPGLRVGYVPQKVAVDWTLPLTVDRFLTLTNPLSREEKAAALESTGIAHLAHQIGGNLLLILAVLHLGGVLAESLVLRRNIVHPMLLGKRR